MSCVLEQEEKIMDIKWNNVCIIHWTRKSSCRWPDINMKITRLRAIIQGRISVDKTVDKRISAKGGGKRI